MSNSGNKFSGNKFGFRKTTSEALVLTSLTLRKCLPNFGFALDED